MYVHSAIKAMPKRPMIHFVQCGKGCNCKSFSFIPNVSIYSRITLLLYPCRPLAVLFVVRSVIVNSLYRVL